MQNAARQSGAALRSLLNRVQGTPEPAPRSAPSAPPRASQPASDLRPAADAPIAAREGRGGGSSGGTTGGGTAGGGTGSGAQAAPPGAPPRRRFNWRCCGYSALILLLLLLIGVPLLHLTVIRPFIQGELIKQATRIADDAFENEIYTASALRTLKLTPAQVNETAQSFWKRTPGASGGRVTVQQDLLVVEVKVYGLPLQLQGDLRPDAEGNVVIKSFAMNGWMNVFFTPEALQQALSDYINVEVLRANRQALRAFQVTSGGILVVYEKR